MADLYKTVLKEYHYLVDMGLTAPRIIQEGLKLVGTREIKGAKHNPIIMGWADTLGVRNIYKTDEMAWCALSMAVILLRAGHPAQLEGYDLLRALKFVGYGVKVAKPMLADIVVMPREGGGHVGVYVAESVTTYHIMGGNQGDAYGFMEIPKERPIYFGRPHYQNQPATVKQYFVDASGKISTNEA